MAGSGTIEFRQLEQWAAPAGLHVNFFRRRYMAASGESRSLQLAKRGKSLGPYPGNEGRLHV